MQLPPFLVALVDHGQLRHGIDHCVHKLFHGFGQVAVDFLSLHIIHLLRQFPKPSLCGGTDTEPVPHTLSQLQHDLPCLLYQLVAGGAFRFVEMQQFLLKDFVGQYGFDFLDTIPVQVRLSRLRRPRHHVDVRVITLVVEGGVPAEVLRVNAHSSGDVVAVRPQKCTPCRSIVIAQPCSVLPLQGDDVRPHIAGVMAQFVHGCVQRHRICVAEQAMTAQPLRSGASGNVLSVAFGRLHAAPVLLQRQRDERRCVGFGGGVCVVIVL